jgi:nicotinamidase-related amidase
MKSALILIDIQNDYFPGGACELFQPEQAAVKAKQVLEYFREHDMPVCHVQHISNYPGANAYIQGSKGAEIHPLVAPVGNEKVYIKHAPNSFFQTGLADDLLKQGINNLIVCGMMSHMCVDTSVRAAKDYGFTITVIDDAVTTMNLSRNGTVIPAATVHDVIMASINGVFAKVITADEFINNTRDYI